MLTNGSKKTLLFCSLSVETSPTVIEGTSNWAPTSLWCFQLSRTNFFLPNYQKAPFNAVERPRKKAVTWISAKLSSCPNSFRLLNFSSRPMFVQMNEVLFFSSLRKGNLANIPTTHAKTICSPPKPMDYQIKIPRTERTRSDFLFRICEIVKRKPIIILATELVSKTDSSPKCGCTSITSSTKITLLQCYGFATVDNAGTWEEDGEKSNGRHAISECWEIHQQPQHIAVRNCYFFFKKNVKTITASIVFLFDCLISSLLHTMVSSEICYTCRDCNTNTNTNTKSQYLGPQYQYQYQYYQNFDPQYQYQYLDPSIPIPEGSIPQKWYWIWIFQTPHYKFSKLILRK